MSEMTIKHSPETRENDLWNNEALFQTLINTTKDAIIAIREDGTIFLSNPAAEEMFGHKSADLFGQTLDVLMPETYRKKHRKYIRSYFSTGVSRGALGQVLELPGLRSNGEIFPMSISLSAGTSAGQRFVMGIARDISERKRVSAAIQSSEERYRSLQENLPLGIYRTNKEGNIIAVNSAFVTILGYSSRIEILNQSSPNLYYKLNDRKLLWKRLKKEGSVTKFEVQLLKKDGTPLWTSLNVKALKDGNGKIAHIDGIVEDISERKQFEEALIESEEKYRILAETAQDIIILHDLEGKMHYINQAGLKCLGYQEDQLLGKSVLDFVSPENKAEVIERQNKRKTGFSEMVLYNIGLLDSKGIYIPFEVSSSIVEKSSGPAMCLIYARDMSARKKLEDQLHQSQKMDSIGTLAGGIAHDFNNLLTIINGLSEIALRKMEEDHPIYRDLRSIHGAGKKAEELTRKLLAFSRKQIINPKIIDINILISDLDKMLRRLIREDILIIKDLYPQLLHMKADPGQIEQILINLVVNARDAISARSKDSPGDKKIVLYTRPTALTEKDLEEFPEGKPGNYILISVRDSGVGMDRATIDKIFEPFYTTKEKGHGTGLGMATVYGIIKQNNGFVSVDSQLGKGTTINVFWPSADEEMPVNGELSAVMPDDDKLRGIENILVVEDDKDVLYFASFALRNLGYNVFEASSGLDALHLVKNSKTSKTKTDEFDLIVTDLIMPGMNGKELSQKVEKISNSIKVLFTSGYEEAYITDNEIIGNEDKFLQKPFTIKQLAEKVRSILDTN